MAMNIPSDAKYGFWVAIGVLAALVAYSYVSKRVPQLAA
jgi:hypothetical protein